MRTYSDAIDYSRTFYQFLGVHSLLIGLFPFFAPVFLWDKHYSLSQVCLFVSLSGIGFIVALRFWDSFTKTQSLFAAIAVSFFLEIIVLLTVIIPDVDIMLVVFSLFYGIYNSFFWTTQRSLFFETISGNNAGRKYGNFQIFVAVFLQIGIFIGGYLLEKSGVHYILLGSITISAASLVFFYQRRKLIKFPDKLIHSKVLSFKDVVGYTDQHNTRTIFLIDGLFLFFESFFWLITLFLLAHESFWKLGVMVIILSIIFFILFVILKNTIDHFTFANPYTIAVTLYSISWLLRGFVSDDLPLEYLFGLLVVITFCTSFFRLAFNKRFYDLARITTKHQYLIKKSYYSQTFIALIYFILSVLFLSLDNEFLTLQWAYYICSPIALVYKIYGYSYFKSR